MTDWLRYIASNPDLIRAFGADPLAGERHYNAFGRAEGRSTDAFDPLLYAASNVDVARAFGTDTAALARHYIDFGYGEGRQSGNFDALRYAASNPDLALGLGIDTAALARHYVEFGIGENRQTASFDALDYAAGNADLIRAYGMDVGQLTRHYIDYGVHEGRATAAFDAVGYLLSNPDLGAAGLGTDGARRHWITFGLLEGRAFNPFDSDQSAHGAAVGRTVAGTFEHSADRDWYQLSVGAGQKISLAVLSSSVVGDVVGGAELKVFDAAGHQLSSAVMTTHGFDNWLSFTAGTSGTIYIEVDANGAAGSYQLGVARVGPDTSGQTPGPPNSIFTLGAVTDIFLGGDGYSSIIGGGGDDILGGGPGQDDITGGAGADYIDGGNLTGTDRTVLDSANYQFSPAGVTVYIDGRVGSGGDAEGDRLFNIEIIRGSAYADKLYGAGHDYYSDAYALIGNGGDDELRGGSGSSFLDGGDGNDKLFGGDGSDTLRGGAGADLIDGGDGWDVADFGSLCSGVLIDLRSGLAAGAAQGDTLINIEAISGSYNDDVLGSADNGVYERLSGSGGNDMLIERFSKGGTTELIGDVGNDILVGSRTNGGEGDDTIVVLRENFLNSADGQGGADSYVIETRYHAQSTPFDISLYISSFDLTDRIDLSQIWDEGGRTLDMADILSHTNGNVIDLSGFLTEAGDSVFGYIELDTQPVMYQPTQDFDISLLTASNFYFSQGIDWQIQIPSDMPIV